MSGPLNFSIQLNGGFQTKVFKKTIGGNLGITFNRNNQRLDLLNRQNRISSGFTSVESNFNDQRYNQSTIAGAFGSLAFLLNQRNKISLKSIINVNGSSVINQRMPKTMHSNGLAEP